MELRIFQTFKSLSPADKIYIKRKEEVILKKTKMQIIDRNSQKLKNKKNPSRSRYFLTSFQSPLLRKTKIKVSIKITLEKGFISSPTSQLS